MNILNFNSYKVQKEELKAERQAIAQERADLALYQAEIAREKFLQEQDRYFLALGQTFDLIFRDEDLRERFASGNPGAVIEVIIKACTRNNQTEFFSQIRGRILNQSMGA